MLISAPSVKNMMPATIMAAPSRKHSRMLGDTGAMVKQSTSTIAVMGSTACSASSSFSLSLGRDAFRMVSTAFLCVHFVHFCKNYMDSIQRKSRPVNGGAAKKQLIYDLFTVPASPEHPRSGSGTPGCWHRGLWFLLPSGSSCRRPWIRPPFWPRPRLPPQCGHP